MSNPLSETEVFLLQRLLEANGGTVVPGQTEVFYLQCLLAQAQGGSSGSGSVTSVGLALPASLFSVSGSPVTGAGTLTGALITQTANRVFAGPATGAPAVPTFRALVAADMVAAGSAGQVQYNNGGPLGADAGLTYAVGTLGVGASGVVAGQLNVNDDGGGGGGSIHLFSSGGFQTILQSIAAAMRFVTFPDATGIVLLEDNSATVTNKSISGADNTLSNIATTSLTGTLQAAQMPALTGDVTTPGGSLATTIANNAVTTGKIANANVTYAKLPSEAASTVLGRGSAGGAGDTQVITMGSGMAMVGTALTSAPTIVQSVKTATDSTTSGSFVDIADLDDAIITTTSATDRVLVRAVLQVSQSSTSEGSFYRLTRNGTAIGVGDAAGSRIRCGGFSYVVENNYGVRAMVLEWLDTPGSAAAHTYAVQWMTSGGIIAYLNRGVTDADAAYVGRTASVLTAQLIPTS